MSLISKKFAEELKDKEMRDAYLAAQTRTYTAHQIRAIRGQRGWTQGEFAEKLHTSQSAVSRMEDREYGKLSLQTLIEIAGTFDCGLVVQLVPYEEFLSRTENMSPGNLEVDAFTPASLVPLYETPKPSVYSLVCEGTLRNINAQAAITATQIKEFYLRHARDAQVSYVSEPHSPNEAQRWVRESLSGITATSRGAIPSGRESATIETSQIPAEQEHPTVPFVIPDAPISFSQGQMALFAHDPAAEDQTLV